MSEDLDHTMAPWLRICIAVCCLHTFYSLLSSMWSFCFVLVGVSVSICSSCNLRCSLPDTWRWANSCASVRKMWRSQSLLRQGARAFKGDPLDPFRLCPKKTSCHENGKATEVQWTFNPDIELKQFEGGSFSLTLNLFKHTSWRFLGEEIQKAKEKDGTTCSIWCHAQHIGK